MVYKNITLYFSQGGAEIFFSWGQKRLCAKFIHDTIQQILSESTKFYISYDKKRFGLLSTGTE